MSTPARVPGATLMRQVSVDALMAADGASDEASVDEAVAGPEAVTATLEAPSAAAEVLPVASRSSSRKVDVERLMRHTEPKDGLKHFGSAGWANFALWGLRRAFTFQFRSFESSGQEHVPKEGGVLCAAWHTNGLIDPLVIALTHPRHFVYGGRHDLVTRPVVGFWARKLGLQPVVRKAELVRGGCTEEEAAALNGRSLLNLANGIAHGRGGALFPEGTSHQEVHLLRLRTGPMRTVLAAAAMARARGLPEPHLQPVGLHYRVRHLYRSDVWIEYAPPVPLPQVDVPSEDAEQLLSGTWLEPEADAVNDLRERLRVDLEPLTPQAPDRSTLAAWQLLGHLSARRRGEPPTTWREEVLATRSVRTHLRGLADEVDDTRVRVASEVLEDARAAAELLDRQGLDGRDVVDDGRLRKDGFGTRLGRWFLILFGLLLAPITVPAVGLQAILGFILGNRQDEGLDARATYQLVVGLIGSLFVWPTVSVLAVATLALVSWWPGWIEWSWLAWLGDAWWQVIVALLVDAVVAFAVVFAAMTSSRVAFDAWMDMRRGVWRRRLVASEKGERLEAQLQRILARLPDVGL